MERKALVCGVLAATLFLALKVSGQEPEVRLRSDTRVVQIEVVAIDGQGRPVSGLTRQQFTLTDNRKQRNLDFFGFNGGGEPVSAGATPGLSPARRALPANVFSNETGNGRPAPHVTVLLLDGVNGWFDNFAVSRETVIRLLDKVPADELLAVYAITKFSGLVFLQEYTTDRAKVLASIAGYSAPGMLPAPPGVEDMALAMKDAPGDEVPARTVMKQPPAEREFLMRRGSEGVRTSLQALAEQLGKMPGRKSVFWLTQGFPPRQLRDEGRADWDETISALNRANVAVNAVDANGLLGPKRFWGPGAILSMLQIAEETGGKAFYHRNDLDAAIAGEIAAARSNYTLGFYLPEEERDGKYHALTIHVDRPGVELQYRRGYYAGSDSPQTASRGKAGLESALLNPVDSTDIRLTAALDLMPDRPRPKLRLVLSVDLAALTLTRRGDRWEGKVDELFVQWNGDGKALARISDTKEFQFRDDLRPRYAREGLPIVQTFPLADGAKRLSIILRDSGSGAVGSVQAWLEEPAKAHP